MPKESYDNWRHWEYRRSNKIKPLNYFYFLLLSFIAFSPLLYSNLLWSEYDTVKRSFFSNLGSWIDIFSNATFLKENPLALLSYFIESLIPLPNPFTHRLINILLHSSAGILLFRLLNRMHLSGALLTALIFTIHPVTVQTIFWPGYRSIIISLCLILWCLFLALERETHRKKIFTCFILGVTSILHPIALIIPLVLLLQVFVKNKEIKFSNFKKFLPYVLIVVIFSIISKLSLHFTSGELNSIANDSREQMYGFSYQIYEYLKIIYFPYSNAFFHPIDTQSNSSLFHILPYLFVSVIYVICFLNFNSIWSRFLIMGLTLLITSLGYACFQRGYFLDGTYALEDSLVYIALIPATALIINSINAFIIYNAEQYKALWYSVSIILIILLAGFTFTRSIHFKKSINTWEYFNLTWNNSVTPKKAISDHLFLEGYQNYRINEHINFLEFILEKEPERNVEKIKLTNLFIQTGQDERALKLYKEIVFNDGVRDVQVLEQAADFFELQGLYIDARRTRELLNETVQ